MVGTCEHYVKQVVHVPTLLHYGLHKTIYLIRKATYSHCGTFLSTIKINIYTKRMRRLLSVSVNYISGERYISYKVTH